VTTAPHPRSGFANIVTTDHGGRGTKEVCRLCVGCGVPARQIGWMCRCGVRLSDGSDDVRECKACGQRYRETASAGRKSLQPRPPAKRDESTPA